ncbi:MULTISPECIES: hypothetical protein [unclassified Desulfosporosinus]|nr:MULTISPECIES: hypothetical protein [unclassified Desulfosporosinus]EGW39987.1 hypothetical protein DOT_2071 [Desulfosporosinus sp. OT]ODA41577.1 hypothetical protein DSBG_1687 [Desulfosporosinus sp. BG]
MCEDSVFGRRSNLERRVRVMASGTLDHPWSALGASQVFFISHGMLAIN